MPLLVLQKCISQGARSTRRNKTNFGTYLFSLLTMINDKGAVPVYQVLDLSCVLGLMELLTVHYQKCYKYSPNQSLGPLFLALIEHPLG